jgi:serine/threonine protein kinase
MADLNSSEAGNQEIEYKDSVSTEAIDLMKKMLEKKPKIRATAYEVLQHSWF